MNISLNPELEKFVEERMASGMYHSSSELISEALQLLKERDLLREYRLQELRQEIELASEQIEIGKYAVYTEDSLGNLAEEIKQKGRKILTQKESI